jgi:phosphoinositide-3-kinase regulatory subunit 4
VARIVEHTAAINEMALSPDHRFFVTCSDDGSVAFFDCNRLERNPLNRSSLRITDQGGKLKCVNFCESSNSIVSTSTNGTRLF